MRFLLPETHFGARGQVLDVADVGMTGPTGHPGGFPLTHFAAAYSEDDWQTLPPFTLTGDQ